MTDDDSEPPADLSRPERQVTVAGQIWIVRGGGAGMAGTGRWGLAPIEAVHFYHPGELRPRYEALLELGRWCDLFDQELVALLRTASPVPASG